MADTTENKTNILMLKAYTSRDLSALYRIDPKTFRKWLKPFQAEIGKKNGYYFNCSQVKIIFEHLDYPEIILPETENIAA